MFTFWISIGTTKVVGAGTVRWAWARTTGLPCLGAALKRVIGEEARDQLLAVLELSRELGDRDGEVETRHALASVELPVKMRERTGGTSSINSTRSVYYMIKVLLAVFVGLFRARPAVRSGGPAPVSAEGGF